jgi:hypothetical protein
MSARDIARRLSLPESAVVSQLQRCVQSDRACRVPVDTPRMNEARFLYRTDRVRPALQALLARHGDT